MKSNGIFARIGLLALIAVIAIGAVAVGVSIHWRGQAKECEEVIRAHTQAQSAVYLCGAGDRDEEQIDALVSDVCKHLTETASERDSGMLTTRVAEISNEVHAVRRYNILFTKIKADHRYGGIRMTVEGIFDYDGYGGYFDGRSENVVYSGKFKRVYQMVKTAEGYKIDAYSTDFID